MLNRLMVHYMYVEGRLTLVLINYIILELWIWNVKWTMKTNHVSAEALITD